MEAFCIPKPSAPLHQTTIFFLKKWKKKNGKWERAYKHVCSVDSSTNRIMNYKISCLLPAPSSLLPSEINWSLLHTAKIANCCQGSKEIYRSSQKWSIIYPSASKNAVQNLRIVHDYLQSIVGLWISTTMILLICALRMHSAKMHKL